MSEMRVVGVRVELPANSPILLLRETDGDRYLPIWIGNAEATAIAIEQQGVRPARPLTHDLLKEVIAALAEAVDLSRDEGVVGTEEIGNAVARDAHVDRPIVCGGPVHHRDQLRGVRRGQDDHARHGAHDGEILHVQVCFAHGADQQAGIGTDDLHVGV